MHNKYENEIDDLINASPELALDLKDIPNNDVEVMSDHSQGNDVNE